MRFLKLCDELLDSKKLQKVRVKVDPVWAERLGTLYSPSFEGYILRECMGGNTPTVKVFIVNVPPGYSPVQNVPTDKIEPIEQPIDTQDTHINYSKLTLLKKAILDKIKEMGKDPEDSDVKQVLLSKDIGFIETFLRQMGLTEEDLLNLYRKCFKRV
jgi:hypothetical protein